MSRFSKDYDEVTYRIIGAAMEVHNELGPGFGEKIYQRSLALELEACGIEATREEWVKVHYKNRYIGKHRLDFVAENRLIEIKAKVKLEDVDMVQTQSYLKATKYDAGLLINFGAVSLEYKRIFRR
jgi:GxxExxY protein